MDDTLVGAIIGGAISGGIGIFIAWYTIKLKDKEWMKVNVYTGLYNWIVSRDNTFQFNDDYIYADQTTSQLTPSQHSMLDKKIRENLDAFVNEGEKWDKMWSLVSVKFERRDTGIFNDFIQPLKDSNLISSNNYITIGRGCNVDTFFQRFLFVWIDPSINNAEDLYQKMKEYAKKKNFSELEYVEEIKKENQEFFEMINKNLLKLRHSLLVGINYNNLMEQANKARHTLSELRISLKNKL